MINCYVVEISGRYLKSYIRELFKSGIDIYDLKYYENKIIIKISYLDYLKLSEIKTSNKIRIIKIYGVNRVKLLIEKYNIVFIFFLLSLFLVFILSKMTFFININANSVLDKKIRKELYDNKITLYSFDKSFDEYKKIAEKIKYNNSYYIEWIEIVNRGVNIDVNIIMRKHDDIKDEVGSTNIVAKKNGIIRNIVANRGQVILNNDDYVKKGDIIVSGLIYRNDNIVDMVKSSADVYAEVWYKVKLKTSYYINKKSITNKKRYYYIEIMGKKFNILGFYKDINKENKKTLYKGSFVSIGINDKFIYKNKKYRYNKNDLKKYLEDKALSSIKKNLNDNEKILEQKTLKTYSKNDKMYIEVFFKTYENIAMEEKAEIIEKEG